MKIIFFLMIFCSIIFSQSELSISAEEFLSTINSLKPNVDSLEISNQIYAADVEDFSEAEVKSSCYFNLQIFPKIETTVDKEEAENLFKMMAGFDSLLSFLQENNITNNLVRFTFYSQSELIHAEKIGTEINVNFGEPVSSAIYKDKKIVYFFNKECKKIFGVEEHLFFFYDETPFILSLRKEGDKTYLKEIALPKNLEALK